MKRIVFFLTVFLGLTNTNLLGQQLCHTPQETTNEFLNQSSYLRTSINNNTYCLKVYFHVIRRDDGTGGQTVAAVNQAFQILNQDYNSHNISFSWDNTIDYIDNTTYYDIPIHGSGFDIVDGQAVYISPEIFTVNNHQDGIDIYLFDSSSTINGGEANGVGSASEFLISGSYQGQSLATSHIVSHEMGHVLFSWHTHRGTSGEDISDGACPELVNGNNSDICGDLVEDTPADPNIQQNVDSSCQWTGSGTDANQESYDPDEQNIMSYSAPQYMSYFTPLQGVRMRNAIATLPNLQQTLTNCCTGNVSLDLYIKDSPDDDGTEPNTVTQHMWTSQDIWVRNSDDNGLTHQNPEYNSNGNPNYIYVRVINNSCETSFINNTLTVNWAKANTALGWPQNWDGSLQNSGGFDLGNVLPTVEIPIIQPNAETIVKIPWVVPNPDNYTSGQGSSNPWHFCILATIDSPTDPMGAYTTNPNIMVRNNNNQAWKNLTIVDLEDDATVVLS